MTPPPILVQHATPSLTRNKKKSMLNAGKKVVVFLLCAFLKATTCSLFMGRFCSLHNPPTTVRQGMFEAFPFGRRHGRSLGFEGSDLFTSWDPKIVGIKRHPISQKHHWLVVEPTHLKNMIVKLEIFPK